jgi:hypothetical protein
VITRLVCPLALLAAGAVAAAETPLPGGIPDVLGPRALALTASTGVAAGNEGLLVNPASVAARKRYSVEAGIYVDRRGPDTVGQVYSGSVVDSMTSPVAGAVSWLIVDEGLYSGNVWEAALAGKIAGDLRLGVGCKYFSLEGPRRTNAATVDAGLFWQVAEYVSVGAAGYNLVPISNEAVAPMGTGVGIGIGTDRSFQVTADWRADFDRAGKTTNRFAAGAEVLLGQLVPVRAGWTRDETLGGSWWSAGAGLVTRSGIALDVGYRQSLDDPNARTIAAALKLFLFQ